MVNCSNSNTDSPKEIRSVVISEILILLTQLGISSVLHDSILTVFLKFINIFLDESFWALDAPTWVDTEADTRTNEVHLRTQLVRSHQLIGGSVG